jgi:hypothetical protein
VLVPKPRFREFTGHNATQVCAEPAHPLVRGQDLEPDVASRTVVVTGPRVGEMNDDGDLAEVSNRRYLDPHVLLTAQGPAVQATAPHRRTRDEGSPCFLPKDDADASGFVNRRLDSVMSRPQLARDPVQIPQVGVAAKDRHTRPVQAHQRRILGRIADEIESYHAGRQSMVDLLNASWALYLAAELRDADRDEFENLYHAVSLANDANQPWIPAGMGSDAEVREALAPFDAWAVALRDDDTTPDGSRAGLARDT